MYYFQIHNKIDIINNSMSARCVKNVKYDVNHSIARLFNTFASMANFSIGAASCT